MTRKLKRKCMCEDKRKRIKFNTFDLICYHRTDNEELGIFARDFSGLFFRQKAVKIGSTASSSI